MIDIARRRKLFIVISVGIIIAGIAAFTFIGRKPFRNLEASDIVSATVLLMPPNETIQITETSELVSNLKEIVIYNIDNSYRNYTGQAVIFTITMSDGTQMEVMEYNPFIVINGLGYKTKYEPCEDLNNYANSLLDDTID
ncbi:MAG: hypothetical protein HDR17_17020 [Lachnospiraceae bacterium]|nr:hypothetical protein [Lachnospiraceae bacterium]